MIRNLSHLPAVFNMCGSIQPFFLGGFTKLLSETEGRSKPTCGQILKINKPTFVDVRTQAAGTVETPKKKDHRKKEEKSSRHRP